MSQISQVYVKCDNPNCLLHSMPVLVSYNQLQSPAITRRNSTSSQTNPICLCKECAKEYKNQQVIVEQQDVLDLAFEEMEQEMEEWFLFNSALPLSMTKFSSSVPRSDKSREREILIPREDVIPNLSQVVARLLGSHMEHADVRIVRNREIRTLIVTSLSRE